MHSGHCILITPLIERSVTRCCRVCCKLLHRDRHLASPRAVGNDPHLQTHQLLVNNWTTGQQLQAVQCVVLLSGEGLCTYMKSCSRLKASTPHARLFHEHETKPWLPHTANPNDTHGAPVPACQAAQPVDHTGRWENETKTETLQHTLSTTDMLVLRPMRLKV